MSETGYYLKLNDVPPYRRSFHLANYVWNIVIQMEWFEKKTIGAQFVDAADSISANIAEGFGRYHKKEKIHHYRYSAGSTKECFDWNEKAKFRQLIKEEEYQHIFNELSELPKEINILIKITNEKLKI
ncbi:MAG: four helix bundle protein [Lewinellaceae bacterium]|nr:four helix bundle protein [Saprospiraceae bacterium]MCB9341308.1 four helix bundle protein [Lewinellaceae bacterium]